MMNDLTKLVLGTSISALLAGSGLFGYGKHQAREKENLEGILGAVKGVVYAEYEDGLNPSAENRDKVLGKIFRLRSLMKEERIKSTGEYFRNHRILFTCHNYDLALKKTDSCYAGKIVETRNVRGVTVYLTRNKDADFEGIETLEYRREKRAFINGFRDLNGKYAVNVEMGPIEEDGDLIQKNIDEYRKNDEYFENSDPRWDAEKQAAYNLIKNSEPLSISLDYKRIALESAVSHEVSHALDFKKDGAFDRETRAYLIELQHSPLAFESFEQVRKPKRSFEGDKIYRGVANRIFDGFMSFPDIKEHKDIYRLSGESVKERAKILYSRWYGQR